MPQQACNYPNTKTWQRSHKKRKLQANITDEHRCKKHLLILKDSLETLNELQFSYIRKLSTNINFPKEQLKLRVCYYS